MTEDKVVVENDDELDGVFEDDSTEKEVTEDVKEDKVEEEEGEEDSAPPAEKIPKSIPIAALHDERRKVKQLREENETLRQQIPKADAGAPDRFEDPEGYDSWLKGEWQKEQDAKAHTEYVASVEKSRGDMLSEHEDYIEVEQIFYVLAQQDPSLTQDMMDSNDPAKFAYEKGKEWQDGQREKLIANLIADGYTKSDASDISDAEIISETAEKVKKVKTPNLATATAAASNTVRVEKEEDIADMFEDQSY